MKRRLACLAASIIVSAAPAAAKDMAAQSQRLVCSVSGLYVDGTRIVGAGSEEIVVEVRRGADPARPATDIRVSGNGRIHPGALLHSTRDQVAFALSADGQVDGVAQTVSAIYELRLDTLRLKRTVLTLFSTGAMQVSEGGCTRPGAAVVPAPAAPAAAAPAVVPDWLAELRRKLKECAGKDPFSESACVERMKARYCANRGVKVAECEGN